jgi:hypothetical protein
MDGESVMAEERSVRRIDRRGYDPRLQVMEEKIDALTEAVGRINNSIMDARDNYGGLLHELKEDKEFWKKTTEEAKRKIVLAVVLGVSSAALLGGYVMLKTHLERLVSAPAPMATR